MMGYFDIFLCLTDKILALESPLMNFGGHGGTSRYPVRHRNIGFDI